MNTPNKHLTSSIRPGDTYTAPLRVLLHESMSSTAARPEFVTHQQNMQDGGMFSGHYFSVRTFLPSGEVDPSAVVHAYTEALKDYIARCEVLGVDPMPDAGVASIPAGMPRPLPAGFSRQGVPRAASKGTP